MKPRLLILAVFFLGPWNLFSQDNTFFEFQRYTMPLEELLSSIEGQSDYFFSYNPESIDLDSRIQLDARLYELSELLYEISDQIGLDYVLDSNSRKILLSQKEMIKLSGFVLDSLSSESLIGAIFLANDKYAGSTNYNGFFSLSLDTSVHYLDIYNVAYERRRLVVDRRNADDLVILMEPRISLNVVITAEDNLLNYNESHIPLEVLNDHYGTSGVNDLIQTLKFGAGVSQGSEAQNGFVVRGGGPHQNLILVDGVPIYEASHLGGLSSIFLPSSIKSIDFHKASFSARYGGRASSVLDVRLKDGNRNHYSRELALGLEGVTIHMDGPISNSTSFNINARSSWFSQLASPLVKRYTDVEELDLHYNDSYAKVSHWFSPGNKLSLSAYFGDDLVKVARDELSGSDSGFQDLNRISWGNKFISLKWEKLISNRLHLQLSAGRSAYDYRSRGSYKLNYYEEDSIQTTAFDILSISKLNENLLNIQLDYYTPHAGQFKFGITASTNRNNPSITESEEFANENMDPVISDTVYNSKELSYFVENEYAFSKNMILNSGIRLSGYYTEEKAYYIPEPRLSMSLLWRNSKLSFSYSRLSQFIHLLSNPGPGLPSDLWVPSTSTVEPELSNNFSVDYSYMKHDISFNASIWYKHFDNLIEYSNPSDILYSLIIDNDLYQVEVDNKEWEERVSIGSGRAYGIEMSMFKTIRNWDLKANYSFSRSKRRFSVIDGGDEFPYKYDTPHSLAAIVKYNFSERGSLILNWQYATGTAYSLLDTERIGADGESVLVYSSRNNFRLPDFHHLDIHYRRVSQLKNGELTFSLGVYNVYNRLNAFYEYLSQDSDSGAAELVKISLYPILPQFNLSYTW